MSLPYLYFDPGSTVSCSTDPAMLTGSAPPCYATANWIESLMIEAAGRALKWWRSPRHARQASTASSSWTLTSHCQHQHSTIDHCFKSFWTTGDGFIELAVVGSINDARRRPLNCSALSCFRYFCSCRSRSQMDASIAAVSYQTSSPQACSSQSIAGHWL